MSHPDLNSLWFPLVLGELRAEASARLESHLHVCPDCQQRFLDLTLAHKDEALRAGELEAQELHEASPPVIPPVLEARILKLAADVATGALRPVDFRKPSPEELALLEGQEPPESPFAEAQAEGEAVDCPWCQRKVDRPAAFAWARCGHCHGVLVAN